MVNNTCYLLTHMTLLEFFWCRLIRDTYWVRDMIVYISIKHWSGKVLFELVLIIPLIIFLS